MPKILPDIEEKIFSSAFDLFGEHGYKKVNMKMIAKEVGIAVGTLYNYYSNKEELFLDVFQKSWNMTFSKLDVLISEDMAIGDKIEGFINLLYDEIRDRKGLGSYFIKEGLVSYKEEFTKLSQELTNRLLKLVLELQDLHGVSNDKATLDRSVATAMVMIFELSRLYPDAREDNIKYIKHLLSSVLTK